MNPDPSQAEFTRTLPVSGPVTLEASTKSGLIRVRRGDDGAVAIRGVLRARRSFLWGQPEEQVRWLASNPPVEQSGNTIRVGDGVDRGLLRRVDLIIEITSPAGTRLRAMGDSADLRVRGIEGPVECETDSGEIEIAGIGSYVTAASDSGSISICDVSGAVDARTDSGTIEAMEIGGRVEARTDSGEIHVSQTVVAPVEVHTDSGTVAVKLAEGGYTVRIRTDSGHILIPDLSMAEGNEQSFEFTVRGGGAPVEVETDSGSITVG
jgi:DUF4097 and DUF4098 domain-containing protein YvlB